MQMRRFTDQLYNEVIISFPPERIISLVPSQTELLFDLGLDNRLVGITKFCIHPKEKCQNIVKIGGTKQIDLQRVCSLKPDIIIGNKEENEKGQIEELRQHYPVWMSDIYTLEDALSMIRQVGTLTGTEQVANSLAEHIGSNFQNLSGPTSPRKKV